MKYLSAQDLMEILQIKQTTAYELMRRSDFPSTKIGRLKRVKEEDLYEWLEQQKQAK